MFVWYGKHNGVVACRFHEATQMNAANSIIKREALEGAGNVLPDPCSDVRVKLNDGCSCGHYTAHMIVCMVSIMASWRAGLTK